MGLKKPQNYVYFFKIEIFLFLNTGDSVFTLFSKDLLTQESKNFLELLQIQDFYHVFL